ncbi:Uncharacterised protein [Bordetella pertussis]|nr:Uncharacterised protein [Bordetella pertussis]CFV97009.1 Uncharacterised protein [Bordetella pertussis]CFW35042.1 Uncharacterised protein [Bordetella pertussis]
MTQGTPATSRPRAATSVATSTSRSPALNASSAFMRSPWVLSPWIDSAFTPSRSSWRASLAVPILVLENTMTCFRPRDLTRCTTAARLVSPCIW